MRMHGLHLQRKPPVGGLVVEEFALALELLIVLAQLVDRPHHLHQGAAETVELPHHQKIFWPWIGQRRFESRALGASFAGLLLFEDLPAAGALQRAGCSRRFGRGSRRGRIR
jgi:hypothetical protein